MDMFCHTIIAEITSGNIREKIKEFLTCVIKLGTGRIFLLLIQDLRNSLKVSQSNTVG